MARIQFENGPTIEFDGDPTAADIEEVAKSLNLNTPTQQAADQPQASSGPQTRFQLKSEQPYDNYSYGDALADTGKTIVNSLANVGDATTFPIRHPIQTASGIINAVLHPVDTAKGLIQNATSTNNPDNVPNWAYGIHNDPINFAVGVATAAEGMRGLAGGLVKGGTRATALTGQVLNNARKFIKPTPTELLKNAEKLTTEILNPSKAELADAIVRGDQAKAVTEATKIMKRADDYKGLVNQFDDKIQVNMNRRNDILKAKNFDIDGENYLTNLTKEIDDLEKLGQATPQEIQQMKDVLGREQAFLAKNGGKIDRLTAQSRKEYLQDQTERLLIKDAKGQNISTEPARTRAMDALRAGLKTAVEGGDSEVSSLNKTYEGLKRARRLASEQAALAEKAVPEGLIQGIIHSVINPNPKSIGEATARSVLSQSRKLSSKTQKISDLVQRANQASQNPSYAKSIIEKAGGKFKQVTSMKNSLYEDEPTIYFDDAKGSTKTIRPSQLSVDKVKEKLNGTKAAVPSPEPTASASKPTQPVAEKSNELIGNKQQVREYNLTKNASTEMKLLKDYTKVINAYPTKDAKRYWINKLDASDVIKAKLLKHYNLLD